MSNTREFVRIHSITLTLYIRELANYMQFTMAEIDPVVERHTAPETVGSRS